MKSPLVSVIVTTRNNESTIKACLDSIVRQTYRPIELIVVDNKSTDSTKAIVENYARLIFDKGPERSAQRNYAAKRASGKYILVIDSDMELTKNVVKACVNRAEQDGTKAIIIPEESFGVGFWAQCKRLERSFYVGRDDIEAARFFDKALYLKVGGYNEQMTGAEDWEFSDRIRKATTISRVNQCIMHNEGHFKLMTALKKKMYYTKGFQHYYASQTEGEQNKKPAASALKYYKLYLSRPGKLFKNPFYGFGVLFMKTAEFAAGAFGLILARSKK